LVFLIRTNYHCVFNILLGKKRKFQIDDEELAAITKREQEEALKKLEEERVNIFF